MNKRYLLVFGLVAFCCFNSASAHDAYSDYIEKIRSGSLDARKKAVKGLGKLHDTRVAEALVNVVENADDRDVKLLAAFALDRKKNEEAVSRLIKLLKHKNQVTRWASVIALGGVENKRAIKSLLNLLNDDDEKLRQLVVISLSDIKTKQVAKGLIYALNDKDSYVRMHAIDVLGSSGYRFAIEPLKDLLTRETGENRIAISSALFSLGERQSAQDLFNTYLEGNKNERDFVDVQFDYMSEDLAMEFMRFDWPDDKFAEDRIMFSLKKLHKDNKVKPIIAAAYSKYKSVRLYASRVLADFNDVRTTGALIHLLKDLSPEIRKNAIRALVKVKLTQKIIKPLKERLQDSNKDIRILAAKVLVDINTKETKPAE